MGERKGTKGLELWCRKMTQGHPGVKVENMTTSWRDGLAFCAIIHHFRPDLIEFDKLNKDDIFHNNELAFRVAEEFLGIPALLEPEDMVEYEVPDRLSILTYLSQFYQTFENQRGKSGSRIAPKRPQSSPDHGIVSPASTSPPTKVQVTIGRARREPCAKCGFPVFIAERLNVGKLLYHRTCFRCARCSSQLTLANYYETENGEFCCELCPDEEKHISKKVPPEIVLSRSLSDEAKTATLQNYSEAPDAYSAHFETALEFPLDGDLKKSFTLTGAESTEFTKARSHFFKSQMESSSDSGSEEISVDLPESKPPPLKSQNEDRDILLGLSKPKPPLLTTTDDLRTEPKTHSDGSSFPSDKKDANIGSLSVSEQTNDRFVTKDNASSSSRVSVRARMKLFENNEDNKSDVNKFSNSSNEVPLGSNKKKATVVAIDDLEDFDNISKKDIDIEDSSSEKNNNSSKVHSDKVRNESYIKSVVTVDEKVDVPKDPNIDVKPNNIFATKTDFVMKNNDVDIVDLEIIQSPASDDKIHTTQMPGDDVIEILDSSQEAEMSHISIDCQKGELESSCITIDDSPVVPKKKTATSIVLESDESFLSANSVISSATNSLGEGSVPKRGYYTAYEVLSPQDDSAILENEESSRTDLSFESMVVKKDSIVKPDPQKEIDPVLAENSVINSISESNENNLVTENESKIKTEISLEREIPKEDSVEDENKEHLLSDLHNSTDVSVKKVIEKEQSSEKISDNDFKIALDSNTPDKDTVTPERDPDYPDDLNPFGDVERFASSPQPSVGVPDDGKVKVSTRPVPAARPKRKIMPSLDVRELTGTPECLARVYVQRISINPFDEDSNEEPENATYNPFDEDEKEEEPVVVRPKKKVIPRLEESITLTPLSKLETKSAKSYNPFEDDEDEEEIEEPVKLVPVPAPRTSRSSSASTLVTKPESLVVSDTISVSSSKDSAYSSEVASRPEPKPRDSLSITSRGSHGGSNSSISSGSAFGSARKKKQAPRPPMPFRNNEPASTPGSLLASPSSSLTQSPNLSGTIRSRKSKKAPLPPNASTPSNSERKYLNERLELYPLGISPINLGSTEVLPDDIQKDKNIKDEVNRNRQSQIQSVPSNVADSNPTDKSTAGRWKRRKGQAPSRPIPQRRIVKSLPISEIKRELDTIEIQQQGLEKQGVRLEQIIREKCEGPDAENTEYQVPIEAEDLILQLFELVNEKNELFRRQAELMYLRRQQRLEEEYADVEYQIRCLMLQPENNKSDSDKVKEEILISRLVEIVERRNEIIECLEMDRRREAEEDNSISSQLNLYSARRDDKDTPKEEEKKDKKKKHKKLNKIIHTFKHKKEKDHKVDVDKDVDESEVNSSSEKKKKKFNLF